MNDKDFTDILRVEGINAKGYGTVPKLIMQDTRLTPEAKCVYSYFCSYAGAGNQAFPSVGLILKHLGMSETRYYKHFKLLKQYGYIKTNQLKENGKFSKTIYTICTNPVPEVVENTEILPSTQNEGTGNSTESPCTNFACSENECTQNVCAQNEGHKRNSILKLTDIKNNISKNLSINQQKENTEELSKSMDNEKKNCVDLNSNKNKDNTINYAQNQLSIENEQEIYPIEFISQQLDTEALLQTTEDEIYQQLTDLVYDVVNSHAKSIKVNGTSVPIAVTRNRFLKLNSGHLEYVAESFRKQTQKISNVRKYLVTALYNSPATIDSYYKNEVNSSNSLI